MKARVSWPILLLCLGCAYGRSVAQKSPAQQTVAVVVVNADVQPARPVPTVRVSLSYLDSAERVTEARDVTNPKGQAWLDVSEDATKHGGLRIEIDGATDLVIYEPADGQLPALPATINVSLLRKGSPLLLGSTGIQAMLRRMSLQITALQRKTSALQGEVAAAKRNGTPTGKVNAGQAQKPDLGAEIAEWAQANGFSDDQVKQQVEQWADGVEKQPGQIPADQKALAELALTHYAAAAQLFNQASDADRQQINAEDSEEQALHAQMKALQMAQEALLDKGRSSLRHLLEDSERAAGADRLNQKYHEATQALESAVATANAEYTRHGDDQGFHELWLQAVMDAAAVREEEATDADIPKDQGLALLARSADDFKLLVREYAALGDRHGEAGAQALIGDVLDNEGDLMHDEAFEEDDDKRADSLGKQSAEAYRQAVEAYRKALEFATKADLPQDWALIQMGLGGALGDEGEPAQSVQAYENALEVFTKDDQPNRWAEAQKGLGDALADEGESAKGDEAVAWFDQSAQAYRRALEVLTKADRPLDWGWVEGSLGNVLKEEGEIVSGDKGIALLDQAFQARQNDLEVEKAEPDWASREDFLAERLLDEAKTASADRAIVFFDEAVQIYLIELDFYTKGNPLQDWGKDESDLVDHLWTKAFFAAGDQAVALLEREAQDLQKAAAVNGTNDLLYRWAIVEWAIGRANVSQTNIEAAATADEAFVKAAPSDARALGMAASLNHDGLFRFDRALELDERLVKVDPSAPVKLTLADAYFTTSHFAECLQQEEPLADSALTEGRIVVRDALKLACEWGAGEKGAALSTERALNAKPPEPKGSYWNFSGAIQFLSTAPAFDKGRASWLALFTAIQFGDRAGMTAALHQLEPILQQ